MHAHTFKKLLIQDFKTGETVHSMEPIFLCNFSVTLKLLDRYP